MKFLNKSHILNPLLTKLVRSRWLDIGLVRRSVFASLWTSTPSRFINSKKKELGQYPAILTSRLVNNPYIYMGYRTYSSCGIYAWLNFRHSFVSGLCSSLIRERD